MCVVGDCQNQSVRSIVTESFNSMYCNSDTTQISKREFLGKYFNGHHDDDNFLNQRGLSSELAEELPSNDKELKRQLSNIGWVTKFNSKQNFCSF